MSITHLNLMFHMYNSTHAPLSTQRKVVLHGSLPRCCVPTCFPSALSLLPLLTGPSVCGPMSLWPYFRSFHPTIHRPSPLFMTSSTAYNKRTSAERVNKRIKIDRLLEEGRHRSSMMWYIRLFAILSVIHIDAWHERKCESA